MLRVHTFIVGVDESCPLAFGVLLDEKPWIPEDPDADGQSIAVCH